MYTTNIYTDLRVNNNIRSIKYLLKFQDALMYDDPIALKSAGYSSLAAP
jgi:hypothetical protein